MSEEKKDNKFDDEMTVGGEEDTLEVVAAIESVDDDTWQIKVMNMDTREVAICKNIREYSAFLQNAVNNSDKENFKATWFPSHAKEEHILEVRDELLKHQEEIESLTLADEDDSKE